MSGLNITRPPKKKAVIQPTAEDKPKKRIVELRINEEGGERMIPVPLPVETEEELSVLTRRILCVEDIASEPGRQEKDESIHRIAALHKKVSEEVKAEQSRPVQQPNAIDKALEDTERHKETERLAKELINEWQKPAVQDTGMLRHAPLTQSTETVQQGKRVDSTMNASMPIKDTGGDMMNDLCLRVRDIHKHVLEVSANPKSEYWGGKDYKAAADELAGIIGVLNESDEPSFKVVSKMAMMLKSQAENKSAEMSRVGIGRRFLNVLRR